MFKAVIIVSILSSSPVKLNGYVYPGWANAVGWVIVAIILAPLPIYFALSIVKTYRKHGRFDLKSLHLVNILLNNFFLHFL
jgi:hypothetical protein